MTLQPRKQNKTQMSSTDQDQMPESASQKENLIKILHMLYRLETLIDSTTGHSWDNKTCEIQFHEKEAEQLINKAIEFTSSLIDDDT
jgi:hypothetical protein